MRIQYTTNAGTKVETKDVSWCSAVPLVMCGVDDVAVGTGMATACPLAQLEVTNRDGRIARAWVGARVNGRGMVTFEISTAHAHNSVSREVTAHWVDSPVARDAGVVRAELAERTAAAVAELAKLAGVSQDVVVRELVWDLAQLV